MNPRDSKEASIVRVVLNEIFNLTQMDPTFISPDDAFTGKLGISPMEIGVLFKRSASHLQIPVSENQIHKAHHVQTPRDLVALLHQCHVKPDSKAS